MRVCTECMHWLENADICFYDLEAPIFDVDFYLDDVEDDDEIDEQCKHGWYGRETWDSYDIPQLNDRIEKLENLASMSEPDDKDLSDINKGIDELRLKRDFILGELPEDERKELKHERSSEYNKALLIHKHPELKGKLGNLKEAYT